MHRYIALFLLLGLTAVGGCVSSSYFEPTPIAKAGNAMVYIYRPEATNPGKKPLTLSYPEVMMDGQSVGSPYRGACKCEPWRDFCRQRGLHIFWESAGHGAADQSDAPTPARD